MDDEDDLLHGRARKLDLDGGHGVEDPFADLGVARLVDGEVVRPRGEKGCLRVEGAVVEEGVDGKREEGGEGGEEL